MYFISNSSSRVKYGVLTEDYLNIPIYISYAFTMYMTAINSRHEATGLTSSAETQDS